MLSGPDALFDLIFRRALKVVCILIINSSGSSPSTANTSLFTFMLSFADDTTIYRSGPYNKELFDEVNYELIKIHT